MVDFNTWFDNLHPDRQAALRDDKWRLAEAAFNAGPGPLLVRRSMPQIQIPFTGYAPWANTLLNELEDLKQSAQLRANDLLREDTLRAASQATADAYGYVQLRLMQLPVARK